MSDELRERLQKAIGSWKLSSRRTEPARMIGELEAMLIATKPSGWSAGDTSSELTRLREGIRRLVEDWEFTATDNIVDDDSREADIASSSAFMRCAAELSTLLGETGDDH